MQIRWNFKILPNQTQLCTLEEWLVTLRKHRNYAMRERIDGFETNNQNVEESVAYSYGSYCEIDSLVEYGSCCPLTCPGWQAAVKIVKTAEVVAREDLRIPNMVKRAKPSHDGKGGYKRNGAKPENGIEQGYFRCCLGADL